MKGRKPKPAALQASDGDTCKLGARKHAEKIASHTIAEKGLPPCPQRLQGAAREAYEFWRDQLEKMNLAEMPDALTLERAAVHYATAQRADEYIAAMGEVIKVPITDRKTGEIIGHVQRRNEWVKVRNESDKVFRQFASEFGLSPVSRTRLTVEKDDAKGPDLKALLSGPRVDRTSAWAN